MSHEKVIFSESKHTAQSVVSFTNKWILSANSFYWIKNTARL